MNSEKNKKPVAPIHDNIFYKYCSQDWYSIIDKFQVVSSYKKNETIFSEGDEVKGIYSIIHGNVKVFSLYDKGKVRIKRLAGDGKILGHRGFATTYYPVSAIALTNTVVMFLPTEIFRTLIRTNPDLSIFLIDYFAEDLREAEERMKSLLHADVKHRIAKILLMLINSFGFEEGTNKLSYCLSRKDFASMAGITYESTVRTFAYFQKIKLIKLEGKSFRIIDHQGLKDYLISHK